MTDLDVVDRLFGKLDRYLRRLEAYRILPHDFGEKLAKMVGFRNLLIHEYIEIDLEKVHGILQDNLSDFDRFRGLIYQALKTISQQ